MKNNLETAYFAGGCFWGIENSFQEREGVVSTEVGYMGGNTESPTYEDVCSGKTSHAESVKVVYNSEKISFERLANIFFEIHDPIQLNRQGSDVGTQYRSVIFFTNQKQQEVVMRIIDMLKSKNKKIVTRVEEAKVFWLAEKYHQKYFQKRRTCCSI